MSYFLAMAGDQKNPTDGGSARANALAPSLLRPGSGAAAATAPKGAADSTGPS
ncbi:hypothetical protein [Micromonospora sp. NPDC006431]|uniref:hypothetical protein n=1 Tax=Micromonospora sp. NPDC006431 TaxID=3364235 RepID=UPI0036A2248B